MNSKIPGGINQSQGSKAPGLQDLKILLERLNQRSGKSESGYEPIQPGGGALRVLPFVLILVFLAVIFGAYELFTGSDLYRTGERFIRENQELNSSFGSITECEPWVPFNFNVSGREGRARLAFSVKGTSGSTKVYMSLIKRQGRWGITSAQYKDRTGLLKPLAIDDKYLIQDKAREAVGISGKGGQHLAAGHIYFKQQDYDRAIAEYGRAIEADQAGYQGYYWRGMAYVKKNMEKEAFADFSKVTELMPRHGAAHNWLGWLHSKNRRYSEAIASLSRALEINPNNGWTYYQRGQCYLASGEREKALVDFRKGCSLGSKNSCRLLDVIKRSG